jgi:hypothetical protein
MGRLLAELSLEKTDAGSQSLVDLETHFSQRKQDVKMLLGRQKATWADNWAVFRVPELVGRAEAPLTELFKTPLFPNEAPPLHPADLPSLLQIPLWSARRLGTGTGGCQHQGEYPEGPYKYYRIDCFSYAPRVQGLGAELRVELRLVYRSEWGLPLSQYTLPAELYFLFPIPEGEGSDGFGEEAMNDLANAVRSAVSGSTVRPTSKSGSVSNGFRVETGSQTAVVYSPRVIALLGDQRGLEVRAVR